MLVYLVSGDSGYPLQPWLMTPILHPVTNGERRYNRAHVRGRNVIERCNGVLKSRFRCLSRFRIMNLLPTAASNIINACAILHNICIKNRLELYNVNDDGGGDAGNDAPDEDNSSSTNYARAASVRQLIIRNHFS